MLITFIIRVFELFLIDYLLPLLSENAVTRGVRRGLVDAARTVGASFLEISVRIEMTFSLDWRAKLKLNIITLVHLLNFLGRPAASARQANRV
jgi:hypothetical protein